MANENDEKKPEGSVELPLDELEGAAGGYILNRGYYGSNGHVPYIVVDDKTGKRLTDTYTQRRAEDCAAAWGVSAEVISPEQYKQIFGKEY